MSIRPYIDKQGNKIQGKWVIDYYPQGRKGKRERRIYTGSESDAYEIEADLRKSPTLPTPINPKVKDVYSEYLKWLELHRSPKYLEDMKWAFKNLIPFFGNIRLSHITQGLTDRYKTERPRNKGFEAICAINKELRYFGTFYGWCVNRKYTYPLLFKIEKIPYRRKPPKFTHPSYIDKMLSNLKGHDADKKRALVLLMFECGLRWKEASYIRWENIDWNTKIICLEITKNGNPDTCFLPASVNVLLSPFKKENGFVFVNKNGMPLRSIRKALDTAAKKAKVPAIRPHMLRRTGANLMRMATKDIELVRNFLRHKDIATTQLYLGVSKTEILEGMNKTADYIRQLKITQLLENKGKKE